MSEYEQLGRRLARGWNTWNTRSVLSHGVLPGGVALNLGIKEWHKVGHVHENYNADTGEGCDVRNSDRFYHWGGLLEKVALIKAGMLGAPEEPLQASSDVPG